MNKVILTGNLGRDPEVRYTQTGKAVAGFSIAVNRGWRSKSENQQQPTVDFFNVTAWDKLAEFCGKYLTKGRKVLVEGRLQTRTFEAQDGSKKYFTEVVADNIEFMDSRRQDGDGSYSNSSYAHSDNSNGRSSGSSYGGGDDMVDSGQAGNKDDDMDIPF